MEFFNDFSRIKGDGPVKPDFHMGMAVCKSFAGALKAFLLLVLCACLTIITGCGSSSGVVKKNPITRFVAAARTSSNDSDGLNKRRKDKLIL